MPPDQTAVSSRNRTSLLKIGVAIGVLVSVAVAAALAFVYSGVYDISATSPHYHITYRLMKTVRDQSIKRAARDVKVPELDDPEKVHKGFSNFHAMCVTCHGSPGSAPSEIAKGLYPEPPSLVDVARRRTAAELFTIIKSGIKMSGMPAWEASHSGDQIWEMVAFLRQYPFMPASEYQEAVEFYSKSGEGGHMHQ